MKYHLKRQRARKMRYDSSANKQALDQIKAVYDNKGKTLDRYIVYLKTIENGLYVCLGMSSNPTHPLGFSQFSTGQLGKHNGKKINFSDLPANIQAHIIDRLNYKP